MAAVQSNATTVEEYLISLPEDRRDALEEIREAILANLPEGIVETMAYGMICYEVPFSIVPVTYNKKPLVYAGLASQKNHMAVYLMGVYASDDLREWFVSQWRASGKRVDLGKSCIRFKKFEDAPVELIGEAIARCDLETFLGLMDR